MAASTDGSAAPILRAADAPVEFTAEQQTTIRAALLDSFAEQVGHLARDVERAQEAGGVRGGWATPLVDAAWKVRELARIVAIFDAIGYPADEDGGLAS